MVVGCRARGVSHPMSTRMFATKKDELRAFAQLAAASGLRFLHPRRTFVGAAVVSAPIYSGRWTCG